MLFLDSLARLARSVARTGAVPLTHGVLGTALLATLLPTQEVSAQTNRFQRRHQPINQLSTPGLAGRWSNMANPRAAHQPQPVRIELPEGGGRVSFFTGGSPEKTPIPDRSLAVLRVGALYRFQISDLPDWPGVELYPTIELIDKLHPPCGRESEFPVPLALTAQEIEAAIQGRLVTKVVYVERPNHASPLRGTNADRAYLAEATDNPFELALRDGRPVAIVRIGGRTPNLASPEPGFFGDAAPLEIIPELIGPRPVAEYPEVLP